MPEPVVPPPTLPAHLGAVVPVHARRGDFVPVVGGWLNVTLPGEMVRTIVEKLLTHDIALVRIKSIVTHTAIHQVKSGDLVAVQRSVAELGEVWIPIDERETREREEREKAERAAALTVPAIEEEAMIGTAVPAPKRRKRKSAA